MTLPTTELGGRRFLYLMQELPASDPIRYQDILFTPGMPEDSGICMCMSDRTLKLIRHSIQQRQQHLNSVPVVITTLVMMSSYNRVISLIEFSTNSLAKQKDRKSNYPATTGESSAATLASATLDPSLSYHYGEH